MLLFLNDEDLQDTEFMNALEDELIQAEKICKSYGYNAEFWIDYKKKIVRGDIEEHESKYSLTEIDIEDESEFAIKLRTNVRGVNNLSLDDYSDFLNDCKEAMNLAEKLNSNFYICKQLVEE